MLVTRQSSPYLSRLMFAISSWHNRYNRRAGRFLRKWPALSRLTAIPFNEGDSVGSLHWGGGISLWLVDMQNTGQRPMPPRLWLH